ncbi:MAG TPA: hypothetical protein VFW65_00075 [Pseudonocardiaceae bacterium]|nr:hypothetical protein [Pseudonocardiaceae bacterium]
MANAVLLLRHSDMVHALGQVDLLDVVARDMTGQLAPGRSGVSATTEVTTVNDPDNELTYQLPTPSLLMIRLAGLAGTAARHLLPPGAITAAVLGSGAVARLQLTVMAHYLPDVSQVAAHPSVVHIRHSADCDVRGSLYRAGSTLSLSDDPMRTAFGANLLVIGEIGWVPLDVGHLRAGALVANATRRDLPDALLAQVDRVCVDDLTLLEHNQHRTFVQRHLGCPPPGPDPTHQRTDGWYRRRPSWRATRHIDTDLCRILAERQRRTDFDDVLLLELLETATAGTHLATRLCRAAGGLGLGLGLGHRIDEPRNG